MNRMAIMQIAIVAIAALIVLVLVIGLIPIWVTVGLVSPKAYQPLSMYVTQKMTRHMIRGMMTGKS